MSFEELYSVLNKRGFFNTFQVLSQFKEYKAEKGDFYRILTDFSNYNSFLRIKDKLLESKLISLEKSNGEEYIGLTKKGKSVYDSLLHLNELINNEN
jgi:predicted transcriptional regulator